MDQKISRFNYHFKTVLIKPPILNEERKDMTYKFTTKGGEVISRLRVRKLNIDGVWGRKKKLDNYFLIWYLHFND